MLIIVTVVWNGLDMMADGTKPEPSPRASLKHVGKIFSLGIALPGPPKEMQGLSSVPLGIIFTGICRNALKLGETAIKRCNSDAKLKRMKIPWGTPGFPKIASE